MKRIDANQNEIVKVLRKCGCSVQSLASVGKGCPDLLIGVGGVNLLAEVKDGSKSPSRCRLTPDEQEWHESWRGNVTTIYSVDHALELVDLAHGRRAK